MSLADHLLHAAARAAIRLWPPMTAKRRIDWLGAILGALDVNDAERVARRFRGGTCLTRSLALAARVPGSEVVIGARPSSGERLHAHAWVEARGRRLGGTEPVPELARLR